MPTHTMPAPRPFKILLCLWLVLACQLTQAEKITIAAASDLKFAMDGIVAAFKQDNPTANIQVIYGSSGKFHTQIRQGAPYDLYFSADIEYARALAKQGLAASPATSYGVGRLVLWSQAVDVTGMTLADLTNPEITRIAIANPKHAPYGKRAEEALRAAGIWQTVEPKLVYGDNIAHTAQFVQTGNAQIGLIALALALNPTLASQGGYALISDSLHQPLVQGFIVTRRAEHNALANRFAAFISSNLANKIMAEYGFTPAHDYSDQALPSQKSETQ